MSISGTYKIGASLVGLTDLNQTPSNSVFNRVELGARIDGSPYVSAYSEVEWMWEGIDQTDYNQLLSFYDPTNPTVFIRTRVESGAVITYSNFQAIMHPPTSEMDMIFRKNVKVKFTKVIAA